MADDIAAAGAQPTEEPNPFAERLKADPSLGEVSLAERARLDAINSYARGSILGAGNVPVLQRDARGGQEATDEFGNPIGTVPPSPLAGKRLEELQTDLARYETMRSAEGPLENIVAFGSTLGGGLASPEQWITGVPGAGALAAKVPGILGRMLSSGASQAAIQGVANPAVQGLENVSGLRQGYSASEHALAIGGGAVLGAAVHGAVEGAGAAAKFVGGKVRDAKAKLDAWSDETIMRAAAAKRQAEVNNMRALQEEDPSLRPGGAEHGPAQPMPDAVIEGDTASVTLPEQAVVADPAEAAAKAAADVPPAPEVGAELANGFVQGPNGYRLRVDEPTGTGGLMLAKRRGDGASTQVSNFYVAEHGGLIDAESVNLAAPESRAQIWQAPDAQTKAEAARILKEMAVLDLTDPKRKALAEELKGVVTGERAAPKAEPAPAAGEPPARAAAPSEAQQILEQARPVLDQVDPSIAPAIEQALAPAAPEPVAAFDFSNPGGPGRDGAYGRTGTVGDASVSYSVPKPDLVEVGLAKTRDGREGQGAMRSAMEALTKQADAEGFRIALDAVPMRKDVDGQRLTDFYKSLGFVENDGIASDTRSKLVRLPQRPQRTGLVAQGLQDADAVKKQWRAETPHDNVERMLEAAPANQKALGDAGREIAEELGVEFKDPGVKAISQAAIKEIKGKGWQAARAKKQKGLKRFLDKVGDKKPGTVTDLVRAGFNLSSPEQADQIIERLAQRFEIIDEGWFVTQQGYFDRKTYVRFKDGMIGELQLWEPSLLEAKNETGHGLYEVAREMPAGPERDALEQQMRDLYEPLLDGLSPSWRDALAGKGGSSPNSAANSAGESLRPDMPTSRLSAGDQALSSGEKTQASPALHMDGAPSSEPGTNSFAIGETSASDVRPANLDSKGNPLIGAAVPGMPEHKVSTAAGHTNPFQNPDGTWRQFHRGVWGPEASRLGEGAWTDRPEVAHSYAHEANDKVDFDAYVAAGNKPEPRVLTAEIQSKNPLVLGGESGVVTMDEILALHPTPSELKKIIEDFEWTRRSWELPSRTYLDPKTGKVLWSGMGDHPHQPVEGAVAKLPPGYAFALSDERVFRSLAKRNGFDAIAFQGGNTSGKGLQPEFHPLDASIVRKTEAAPAAPVAPAGRSGLIGAPVPGMPEHKVSTAAGRTIEVAPVVVEARDLVTSADGGFDQAVQPRQRDRAASQAQIRDIATQLDPERLGYSAEADRGAPIVGSDRMVESGNGRVLALRRVYEQGGEAAERYRAWLEAQGVDVAGFQEPVLVRQRLTSMSTEERGAFGMEANQAATLSMSAAERGLADARLITPEMLDLIRNPDDLGALANLDFRKAFVRALPATEHGSMVAAGGEISSEGLTRIRNAILARAYDNSGVLARIAEATSDDAKSLTNALVAVAPDWAKLRADIAGGLVRSDMDLTPALLEAVTRTTDLRAKGQKLDTFLSQQDAFDRLDETVEAFMRMFYDAKGRRAAGAPVMAERLRAYASEARKVSADGGLDLGLAPVTTRELMSLAATKGAKNANEGQTGLQFRRAGDGAADNTGADGVQFRRGAGDGSGDAVDAGGGSGARGEGRDAGGSGAGGNGAGEGDPASAELGALRSLQQQVQDLADVLDLPMRQGRTQGGRGVLGQYDQSQDVVRMRNVADMGTFSHEAGHALERRVEGLPALLQRFDLELAKLDYDPTRGDAREGFAEWLRLAFEAPARAIKEAPSFSAAFRNLMEAREPALLAELDKAIAAHAAWRDAPTGAKLEAMVRKPEDETVLRSIKRDGLPTTVGLYLSKAYEAIFDDRAPAARAVRSMLRAMQPHMAPGERVRLEGADNPENLVRLFARSQQAAVQDMREGVRPYRGIAPEGPSLRDALITATGEPGILGRWNGPAVEAFDRYMVVRRAELLWRKFDAGELENRPIALSREEVRAEMARLEAENPNFRAGSDQVHGFTRELLRKQYESGLIDADLYGRLMGEEFYVPLFRHMDDKPNAGSGAGGQDGPGNVQLIKRIGGSDRDIIPPTQSLMTQAFLVNRTVAHNDIIKSFVSLSRQARAMGAEGIGRILEEIPAKQMMGKRFDLQEAVASAARAAGVARDDLDVLTGSLTDVFGDDPIMATIFRAEPTGKRGEPIVFYKEGGQLRAVRLQSKDEGLALYETLASLPPVARDFALQIGAATSSALRTGIVTNPVFAVSNFIRDQLAVGVLRSDYVPFWSGGKGVLKEVLQGSTAETALGKFARDNLPEAVSRQFGSEIPLLYAYAGGVSPGAGSAGLSELVDRDVQALARKGWGVQKLGGIADLQQGHLLGPLKAVAETVETAEAGTRLAVFKSVFDQKRRQGLSDYDAMIEAAAQSTDVMDFGRHGSGTLYLRALVPFFNAHLQGLDKARRTLLEPLYRAAVGDIITEADAAALRNSQMAIAKMVGVGGALGVGYGLWASQYEAYRDASPELKATHLIIPGDAFGRPGKVLVIPKPFELAMGVNVGEALGLHISTGDPRAFHQAVEGMREVLQPPNPLTGIPLLKTGFELALNRSLFTGRDIVPENLQNRENPRFEVKPNTSSLAKAIGDKLNISPIKVDYAVGSMFGNWGRDLMAVSNVADPDNPAAATEDTTFIRRFIKGADRVSETSKKFWDNAGQRNGAFAQAAQRYKALTDGFQDREAADYLGSLPAAQRAYVTLTQGGDEQGKSAFKPEDKRINPIIRSAAAVQVLSGYIRELGANTQRTAEDGNRVALNPTQRREVIDSLRQLAAIEQRNALVLTSQEGYAGRKLLSAEDQFKVLQAKSPEAAAEVATRYAGKQIVPTALVAQLWPEAQKRLLADGTQADIHELGLEAKGEYAFGGEKVKLQPKRRVPILPGVRPTNPRAPDLSPGASIPGPTTVTVATPLQ